MEVVNLVAIELAAIPICMAYCNYNMDKKKKNMQQFTLNLHVHDQGRDKEALCFDQ